MQAGSGLVGFIIGLCLGIALFNQVLSELYSVVGEFSLGLRRLVGSRRAFASLDRKKVPKSKGGDPFLIKTAIKMEVSAVFTPQICVEPSHFGWHCYFHRWLGYVWEAC